MRFALLVLLSGCFAVGVRGGPAGGLDDAPIHRMNVGVEVGTYLGIEQRVILNPFLAGNRGPLRAERRAVEVGGGIIYTHPGLPVSPQLRISYGDSCDQAPADCATTFSGSLGVALVKRPAARASEAFDNGFAAVSAGIAYHRQVENSGPAADFLGLEVSVRLGIDLFSTLVEAKNKRDDNPR